MLPSEAPGNGSLAVTIWYSTSPKANRSVRPSDCLPWYLFGRHVCRGADDPSHVGDGRIQRPSQVVGAERRRVLGQTEVEHLDGAVRSDLDVGRLQIAVNDALLVGGVEGFRDLSRNWQRFVDRDPSLRNPVGECGTSNQFQYQRPHATRVFEAVDRGDVRMIEGRQEFGFPLESAESIGVLRESVRQDLERHVALQPGVLRLIDLAHPACADMGEDFVDAEPGAGSQDQALWIIGWGAARQVSPKRCYYRQSAPILLVVWGSARSVWRAVPDIDAASARLREGRRSR